MSNIEKGVSLGMKPFLRQRNGDTGFHIAGGGDSRLPGADLRGVDLSERIAPRVQEEPVKSNQTIITHTTDQWPPLGVPRNAQEAAKQRANLAKLGFDARSGFSR